MTNSTDNQNYVRAVLAGIGIDFDETEMFISVSHCQSDEVSFTCSISASELRESAGHYVDTGILISVLSYCFLQELTHNWNICFSNRRLK